MVEEEEGTAVQGPSLPDQVSRSNHEHGRYSRRVPDSGNSH